MLSRREFIKACLSMAAGLSVPALSRSLMAEAAGMFSHKPVVIYLEAVTCTGDLISLLNARDPDIGRFIREDIDLRYQTTLMVAEGTPAVNYMYQSAEEHWGEYILIIEGAIPVRDDGIFGVIGEAENGPLTALRAVRDLAPGAKYILPFGVCACFGGQYATPPNPSEVRGVWAVLDQRDKGKVVNVSGCPGHPDWLIGILTHLMVYGMPELDAHRRPKVFFGRTVHDLCPRRRLFEQGIFASQPGESGCLYKIGCKGPVAGCDVPLRQWNTYYHWQWPIGCNVPCIACTEPGYPTAMMPFYQHLPDINVFGTHAASRTIAKTVGLGTGAAIAGHFAASLITRRVQKNYRKLQEPLPPLPAEPTPTADLAFGFEAGPDLGEPDLVVEQAQPPVTAMPRKEFKSPLARQIQEKWKEK